MAATEAKAQTSFHPTFLQVGKARQWKGKLAPLFGTLAQEARHAPATGHAERAVDRDFHWRVLPQGAVVGVRVRYDQDGRYELRIARADRPETNEQLEKWHREIATFLKHFEITPVRGDTPAEADDGWYFELPPNPNDKGKAAFRLIQLRKGEVRPGERVPPVSNGRPGDAGGVVPGRGSDGTGVQRVRDPGGEGVRGGGDAEDAGDVSAPTDLPWWMGVLPVLDFETTSVDPLTCRPVSVSLVLTTPKGKTLPGGFSAIIDAGVDVPEEAAKIHGITTERAREEGVPVVDAIQAVIDRLVAIEVMGWPLLAYNVSYDWQVLHAECARGGHVWNTDCSRLVLVDPLVLDRHVDRYRKGGRKLEAVARHYGVWRDGAHDAFVDACMTADVLRQIMERYPELQAVGLGEEMIRLHQQADSTWIREINQLKKRNPRPGDAGPIEERLWPACGFWTTKGIPL